MTFLKSCILSILVTFFIAGCGVVEPDTESALNSSSEPIILLSSSKSILVLSSTLAQVSSRASESSSTVSLSSNAQSSGSLTLSSTQESSVAMSSTSNTVSSTTQSSSSQTGVYVGLPECEITNYIAEAIDTIGTEVMIEVTASDSLLYIKTMVLFVDGVPVDTIEKFNIGTYTFTLLTDSLLPGAHTINATVTNDSSTTASCAQEYQFVLPPFSTYSFDAEISKITTPRAQISSYLDSNNNTHIAWIKNESANNYLMYTKFTLDTKQFVTTQITTPSTTELKWAPSIITDNNNNPHIVYMIKRDPDLSSVSRNGNNAIMYAGDSDGDGTFEVLQVSANSLVADSDVDNSYNSYVNGRPQISLEGSTILIGYAGESNSLNDGSYIIFARKNGATWTRSQEFKFSSFTGTYSGTDDKALTLPSRMPQEAIGAWIDISSYNPQIVRKESGVWATYIVAGYTATFGNSHPQIDIDAQGVVHFMWFHDEDDQFNHTIITGNTSVSVLEVPIENAASGNFFPAAFDQSTHEKVFFYERSNSDNGYLIRVDSNNVATEYFLSGVVNVFGKSALHAGNGTISLVTGSDSRDKIYVTVNNP
ncbi:MAG: hypothetical protein OCD01_17250 [Fibrobacterales bacterium]